jgi:metal-responsive CopG/Arc/MetJ family transcriptional regulator
MNTQKVAITIPMNLVNIIDAISKQRGLSRSKFISIVLEERISEEKNRSIKEAYNRIFSDESVCNEQLQTAGWFEGSGNIEGQEW